MCRMIIRWSGLIVAAAFCQPSLAQDDSRARSVAIGPWQIEASFTEQRFDRCVMSRTTEEGVETRFTRDEGGLSLSMSSPRWELGKGEKYAVEFAADSFVWSTMVSATNDAVRASLTDQPFNDALKSADMLEVRGAGSAIQISLDKSAAALTRLEKCYEANNKAVQKNPFAAPKP